MKKLMGVLLCVGIVSQAAFAAGFSSWQYYRTITIAPAGLGAAVTNFPVCIQLNNPANHNDSLIFSQTLTTGYDIRFTASDGVTALPYQRANWNTTTKTAEFWVLVPSVATTTTTVKMYWGNSSAADTSQPNAVFDTANGYQGVWHMDGPAGVGDSDATINKYFATAVNSPADTAGMIGRCKWFNHSTMRDSVIGSAGSKLNFLQNTNYTISAWVCPDSFPGPGTADSSYYAIASKGNYQYYFGIGDTTIGTTRYGRPEIMEYRSSNHWISTHPILLSAAHQWVHTVGRVTTSGTADTLTVFVNGTTTGSPSVTNYTGATQTTTGDVCIGWQPKVTGTYGGSTPYRAFWGRIDELQMANVARDTNWIKLSYETQMSGSTAIQPGANFLNVPPPVAPTLATPANGATNVPVLSVLTWGTVTGAATYRVQVSALSDFTILAADDSTLTAGTKTLTTALSGNVLYYWRANAKNSGGTGAWSTVFSFTTVLAAPAVPVLTSPANAATGITVTPALTWGTVFGAATYRVQLSTISTFATTVADDSTLTVGTKAITGLANSTVYFWRANAKNAGGTSAWTNAFSFTTNIAAPAVPVLSSPSDTARGIAVAPTLTWGTVAGAATYRLQLSIVSTFASTVVDDSTLTVGTKAITGLVNSVKYYWRVNAKNTGGTSAWAVAYSFTTLPAAPGTAPTLSAPANAAVGISVTPTLTWGMVGGAATYRVQLSTVSTFASTVVDDSTLMFETKAITTALTANTTYYWRVNAKNDGGTSAWSTIFSFTTTTTGVFAATPHYVPVTMGHNGVLEVYMANGSRVMQIAYSASATKAQLLNTASKTLAKGYYTYRFRGTDVNMEIVGKLIK